MTKNDVFYNKGKYENTHCSVMSNEAWCDLKSKGVILKIHDMCPNPKCKCKK